MARARTVQGLKPGGGVGVNARKIVATRAAEFFGFAPYLADPQRVTELHDMRIAAKRLRYALELFQDALGPDTADAIGTIKEFQDIVGQIHDNDVLVDILGEYLATRSVERARSLSERAIRANDALASLKRRSRAFVTDEAWVAEQAAIAAAIARATRERHAHHGQLVRAWDAWVAAGLRERLEALTAHPSHGGGKKNGHHPSTPEQSALAVVVAAEQLPAGDVAGL